MIERTVTLAGKEYRVAERPTRQNAAFRRKLEAAFAPLAEALTQATTTDLSMARAGDLVAIVRSAGGTLLNSMDVLVDLVCGYAPAIAADLERLQEEAYDSEFLEAFTVVLGLAYPFGAQVRMLARLATSQSGPTSMN